MKMELTPQTFKDKTFNKILIALATIAVVVLVPVLIRDYPNIFDWTTVVTEFLIVSMVSVALLRHRFSVTFKVYFVLACIVIVIVVGFFARGYLSSAKLYNIFCVLLASFAFTHWQSVIILILLLICHVVFGFLYTQGSLVADVNPSDYVINPFTWIAESVIICMITYCLLYMSDAYQKEITNSAGILQKQESVARVSERKYATLFENAQDTILLFKDGIFTDCNQRACEMFQCDKDYLIGKSPIEISPTMQRDGQTSENKAQALIAGMMSGQPQFFEWQHVRSNGEVFDLSISLNRVDLEDKAYGQAILRDITEQKRNEEELSKYRMELEKLVVQRTQELELANASLKTKNTELHNKSAIIETQNYELANAITTLRETQSQLVQTEKMASLGVLTAGVAHEINNPLNYIMGGYAVIKKKLQSKQYEDVEDMFVFLEGIKAGIERASNIVSILNQFSRKSDNMDEACDINQILKNCMIMLQHEMSDRVEVNIRLSKSPIVLNGNVGNLHQVFINVLINALQAIPDKGKISVSTERQGHQAVITIADDGCGIPEKNLKKVIDPFFTTKDPGKGTGLGLSVSYAIVQKHNGRIDFQSDEGKGTVVTISLPV